MAAEYDHSAWISTNFETPRAGHGSHWVESVAAMDSVTRGALAGLPVRLRARDAAPRALPGEHVAGASSTLVYTVIALATALGLGLRLYQLMRPGYLLGVSEYDDGVDFGSAVRLVSGALPYRDFVLVQPPGITALMTPVALLAKVTGTQTGLAMARMLTACVGAASVMLVGLLVRRRGIVATTVACGILAVFPAALLGARTVLLEPWLVLFCLLGSLAVLDGDHLTERTSRLVWGGVAFGIAGAVKVWAVFPVIVVFALCARRLGRRSTLVFLAGVIAGDGVLSLPFLAFAPSGYYHSVLVAQLSRVDVSRIAIWYRFRSLTGLDDFTSLGRGAVFAVALAIGSAVLLFSLGAWRRTRRRPPDIEYWALGTAALVLAALCWPPDYYEHYGAFFAPFLALSVALPADRLLTVRGVFRGEQLRRPLTSLLGAGAALGVVAMAIVAINQIGTTTAGSPGPSADRQIPAGACVLTDQSALTIAADRFTSNVLGCSPMVDAIGTDYALSRGRNGVSGAGDRHAVDAVWLGPFKHAQYVWLSCAPAASRRCNPWTNRRIPWTPAILRFFRTHFTPVPGQKPPAHVFVRNGLLYAASSTKGQLDGRTRTQRHADAVASPAASRSRRGA